MEKERDKRKDENDEPSGDGSFNMDELRALAALVDEHGYTDFEFENENIRVRLSRGVSHSTSAPHAVTPAPTPQVQPTVAAPAATPVAEAADEGSSDGLHKILSPIVGTFYRAPGPDKDPYVKEGSRVSPTSIVCIVEAMKLMNEIEAETAGGRRDLR